MSLIKYPNFLQSAVHNGISFDHVWRQQHSVVALFYIDVGLFRSVERRLPHLNNHGWYKHIRRIII